MSDESQRNQGLPVAHTPGEISAERAAKIGTTAAATEIAMADLARQLVGGEEPAADQPSLMLDEMDEQQSLFAGPVRHVAETIDTARNGRGRPKGSQNKASRQFAETLQRMGYRHPGLNLAALANADPVQLARELSVAENKDGVLWRVGCSPADAMAMILKANAELLPYFESKRPTEMHVEVRKLGLMLFGEVPASPGSSDALDLRPVPRPDE